MEPVAHSPRKKRGIPAQSYRDHVAAVRKLASAKMQAALSYQLNPDRRLLDTLDWAAAYHDLGKLESANQEVLRSKEAVPLPMNHVDAGTAYLRSKGLAEAAIAVYGHHTGLCDLPDELARDRRGRHDPSQSALRDPKIKLATDASLPKLLSEHAAAAEPDAANLGTFDRQLIGFERRLLLSCLVDADHHDTAQNYQQENEVQPPECRWKERLQALDAYVASLAEHADGRTDLRSKLYAGCRSVSPKEPIWACDSPVGSGKTTAIMAYLLKAAVELKLRHIFVVLPYTNIIEQSVRTYRDALVLPGENPEGVVAAHHHNADFESVDIRYLTTLWDAPIIVTTAVQFFETLAASHTGRLRKLHQLPGSAVFIDEAHAAMPIHLWPFMWEELRRLSAGWSCRFVLGSGSLIKFWESQRIMGDKAVSLPLMVPEELQRLSSDFERRRVRYETRDEVLTLRSLCDWVQEFSGPRLVILNTVQSAAEVAREFDKRGICTKHLSTALAPIHRGKILQDVEDMLKEKPGHDWVLVATSCVEAGVDLSFASAFRERSRATSLVQVGGRVNRHGERGGGVVWDFVVNDPLLPPHSDFRHSREVVEELFRKGKWDEELTALMTYALEQEFKRSSKDASIQELFNAELHGSYPLVAKLTRLISADTRVVVIDSELSDRIRAGAPVSSRELRQNSVQLWTTKVEKFRLQPVGNRADLYSWDYGYDPDFLGIMKGVLQQADISRAGGAVI
ncbi:MAG TPA: CRISPR-associated endonuclease Cas3'' [Candidatus Angelobacter sp.]|nr:CRISPR-associated endonuclease Cas3'' [Candidatus Angelobacter sp.]